MQLRILTIPWAFLVLLALALTASAAAVLGSPAAPVEYTVRNAPGTTADQTLQAVRLLLREAALQGRDEKYGNTTNLDKSFVNAKLFKYTYALDGKKGNNAVSTVGVVEFVCNRCYIRGNAAASMTIDGSFNASSALGVFKDNLKGTIDQLADYADDYVRGVIDNVRKNGFNADAFDFPPLDLDLNIDLAPMPECRLRFGFDHLELYIDIQTTLSGGVEYTLNLYTTRGPLGFEVGPNLLVGVVFSVDLIISVETEIDIRSGFHLLMEDGIAFDITMFSRNVSNIEFNGAMFEFLPVTIETDGAILAAVLRIGMRAGLSIHSPRTRFEILGHSIPSVGAGVEVGVYANLAELVTNVTLSDSDNEDEDEDEKRLKVFKRDDDNDDDDDECRLHLVQAYQFGLGAAAGASVTFNDLAWGPTPAVETPIFYTTVADACAIRGSKAKPTHETGTAETTVTTDPAKLNARQNTESLTTTTLSRKVTYSGVECMSIGMVDCPASLKSVHSFTTDETLVTAVPSGVDAAWPDSTQFSGFSAISFGEGAREMLGTSGAPKSYIPPPPTTSSSPSPSASGTGRGGDGDGVLEGKTGGVSNKLIIGLSVGLGVPVLAAIIGALVWYIRRKKSVKYTPAPKGEGEGQYEGKASSPVRS